MSPAWIITISNTPHLSNSITKLIPCTLIETTTCSGLMFSMIACSFGDQTLVMDLKLYLSLILVQVPLSTVSIPQVQGYNISNILSIKLVDIAVDWISDKIYWTNINQIMVYDLHRRYQTTVINSAESYSLFYQVVVDPNMRWSYHTHTIIVAACKIL